MKRKPTAFHRHLLVEAWRLTWERKSLWVLGLFAGLALSGAVIEPVVVGVVRATHSGDWWQRLQTADPSVLLATLNEIVRRIADIPPLTAQIWFTLFTVAGVIGVWFLVVCQSGLLSGLIGKSPRKVVDVLWRGWHNLWSLFVLDVVACLANGLLLLMVAMPIVLYVSRPGFGAAFFAAFALLIYLPLAIGARIMASFAAVQIVRRDFHVAHALEHAWYLFNDHWLAALETGLVLSLATVAVAVVSLAALLIASLPFILLFTIASAGGSIVPVALLGAAGMLGLCLLMLTVLGALTTFRYAIWAGFHGRASHSIVRYTVVAKLKRLFTA